MVSSHVVEVDVDAVGARFEKSRAQVLDRLVVQGDVHSRFVLEPVDLLLGAGAAHDPTSLCLRDLARCGSDRSGGTRYEHGLPRLRLSDVREP